jgi:thiamine pyrophosphokinase
MISNFFASKVEAENDFLIVAHGLFEEEVVKKYLPGKPIVALDGAANELYKNKIEPMYILGVFDSLQEIGEKKRINSFSFNKAMSYFRSIPKPKDDSLIFEEYKSGYESEWTSNREVTFVRAVCQNYTDLEKGIQFCALRGAKSITIVSALGGERTDHSLVNFSILKRYHRKPYKVQLVTKKEVIEFLKNETVNFKGTRGAKFGLFGFPKARAFSKGLLWEMNDYPLELGLTESSCNILKDSNITITVKGEALMIRPNY